MRCPFCNAADTKVTDTRISNEGFQVRRRRQCLSCGERFTTYEHPELTMPTIIKSNGIKQPFNEEKIRAGMLRALEKRSIGTEQVDCAINNIKTKLRALKEKEVHSNVIGKMVMEELESLDAVAYIRFASVYLSFKNIKDFSKEISKIEKQL